MAGVVDLFTRHGAELVALHAFTLDTMPFMLDHAGALQFWEEEAARSEPTDLIVLAWRRKLAGGHGQVVVDALVHAGVPVLLVPMGVEDPRPALAGTERELLSAVGSSVAQVATNAGRASSVRSLWSGYGDR